MEKDYLANKQQDNAVNKKNAVLYMQKMIWRSCYDIVTVHICDELLALICYVCLTLHLFSPYIMAGSSGVFRELWSMVPRWGMNLSQAWH